MALGKGGLEILCIIKFTDYFELNGKGEDRVVKTALNDNEMNVLATA